ncbi:ABC transporter permease [Bifidobacterium leontopitheci]|uniref:Peptide ABC transporter permease n=1 Tax=Bifidobacterium leontopitheci TaxID=2650774 RepID=A0A6I1GF30_9BIFI|nr:ABC transporter permease [Bifidobacterium leontopitheci]KAB7790234.1 peptide ABC transporter permease [Bifidobacterium leontopitheci]
MLKYTLKRFGQMILMMFLLSILVFFLFALMPGDFFSGNRKLTPTRLAELRALYGLDKPPLQRYFIWLGNVLHGDFGWSLKYNEPVTDLLKTYMFNSFIVALAAMVIAWTIAVIVGVYSATHQYAFVDKLVTVIVFASLSFPSFFIGLLAIKFFAVDLKWLPVGGMIDTGSNSTGLAYVLEVGRHMILPVLILAFFSAGGLTRYFRSGMLDVLRLDFVRCARARGIKEHAVVYRHALRNALLPAITLLGFELPGLFSGAIITEQIFGWPGIGPIQLDALNAHDYEVLMTCTLLLSFLTILGNFLADVMYSVADPRVRLAQKAEA